MNILRQKNNCWHYFSILAYMFMTLCSVNITHGQEWSPVSTIRQVGSQGLYGELESRLPPSEVSRLTIAGSIKGTAHEMTHGLNAKARNDRGLNGTSERDRNKYNALYVYGGYVAILKEPPITMRQVAAAVPADKRGLMYREYLIDPQALSSWNNRPLYILDEMISYLNGAIVGCEMGDDHPLYDYHCAVEFHHIAQAMYYECKKLPSGTYNHLPLKEFLNATREYMLTLAPYVGSKYVSQVWRPSRSNRSNTWGGQQRSNSCPPGSINCPSGNSSGNSGGGRSYSFAMPMEYGPPRQKVRQPIRNALRKLLPKFPRKPLCVDDTQLPVLPGPGPGSPVTPTPTPTPVPTPTPTTDLNLDTINDKLDKLEKSIADIPAGDQGIQGIQGIQGEHGVTGDTGDKGDNSEVTLKMFNTLVKTVESLLKHEHESKPHTHTMSDVELNKLVDKIIAKLPPRRYQAKNPDGTLRGPVVEKQLGEILYLKSIPVEFQPDVIDVEP